MLVVYNLKARVRAEVGVRADLEINVMGYDLVMVRVYFYDYVYGVWFIVIDYGYVYGFGYRLQL